MPIDINDLNHIRPEATFYMPEGFLWGTATSSHQVEGGNNNNNWSLWENNDGHILNGDRSGDACQWWQGRWAEDFDRASESSQNAHRLSIEWSRVQPAIDQWDMEALAYYREMLKGLYDRGITPMVTLHHFSDPIWLYENGGWEWDKAPQVFEAYVRRVVEALKDYVSLWVPINEPNVYVYMGYMDSNFPPAKPGMAFAFNVMENMLKAHAAAYRAIHEIQKEARVGSCINYRAFWPKRPWLPLDKWMAGTLSHNYNDAFIGAIQNGQLQFLLRKSSLPQVKDTQDFVGINYYTADWIAFNPFMIKAFFHTREFPQGQELSETGFLANVPDGLFKALKWASRFGLPIMVTENGIEDSQDSLRPQYIVEHLQQLWRASNYNWQIKGYFHWSLVDNFEWDRGWTQRFGLWGLDIETQERIRRPSVDLYAAICKQNGLSTRLVEQYAPQVFERLYPVE